MKRGDPLQRRAPLARGARLSARSVRSEQQRADRAIVRERVFARDGWTCQLAGHGVCFGINTPHHRRKASQGGTYTEANLKTLCQHHNDELEADADLAAYARSVGLVVRRGDPEWEALGA